MIRFCFLLATFLSLNQYIMAQNNKGIHYIQNDNGKIYYRDTGSEKTTIVLVSGGTLGLETWDNFQEQLSRYARVISYDRNGLGNSDYIPNSKNIGAMVEELDMLINKLDVKTPIILVGHSIGGYIVRKYMESFPEKVKALFLIDAFHKSFYKELKIAVTEKMWNNYVGNWQNLISQLPLGAADEVAFNLEVMKSDENYYIPSDIPVYLFTSIKEVEIEERFVEFNKRAFQIHLRLNKQLENENKNLRHFVTDKSSHYIYLEEPDLIVNEILKLIEN